MAIIGPCLRRRGSRGPVGSRLAGAGGGRRAAAQEAVELLVGQLVEHSARCSRRSAAMPVDQAPALVGEGDTDDAPVLIVALALDEPALLHPVHDPGGAGLGDIEGLGQAAHGQRVRRPRGSSGR